MNATYSGREGGNMMPLMFRWDIVVDNRDGWSTARCLHPELAGCGVEERTALENLREKLMSFLDAQVEFMRDNRITDVANVSYMQEPEGMWDVPDTGQGAVATPDY
jgi:hypothetical protein